MWVAFGSRAGRESSDGAVDRGAAGFATLQADVVAAMAKAGQRGSRGMGQPPSGGDQLFQPGALIGGGGGGWGGGGGGEGTPGWLARD